MNAPMAFARWAETYELFEGATARATWEDGIVRELLGLGRSDPRVLDVGAGTGMGRRVIAARLPAARVTSLDRSPEMLDVGGVPPQDRVVADMSDFRLEGTFDAVVSGFDALNYLDAQGMAGFFDSAAAVLAKDGRIIFDYSSPKVLREDWADVEYRTERDGLALRRAHRFDDVLQRSETRLELSEGPRTLWTETHIQYTYDTYELYRLAARAGFTVERARDIDGSSFSPAATTHVWVLGRAHGT